MTNNINNKLKMPNAQHRISYMAGLTKVPLGSKNAIELRFGRKGILLGILPFHETLYLYRALVSGQTQQ